MMSKKEKNRGKIIGGGGDKLRANDDKMALTSRNYKLLLIGAVIILIGFMLMIGGASENPVEVFNEKMFSFRRITLAPIVVLGGFVFVVYAIMSRKRPKENNKKSEK